VRYGSVCSGIEAATAAWHPLGWEPAFFSEIEPFPRAVLSHHYPDVPLHGDFTTIGADEYGPIDLLVGGTPCQSFSIAGLRGGLDDDRGNLALEFLRLAQRTRAKWLVWENVPGVLSSNGGRDFGSILGGMVELGYGFAYRVLDAQYFGVAQRRRRVFVVGCLGDWRSAAAVLFERHSLQGHSAPSREKGQRLADTLTVGANQCSRFIGDITEDEYPEQVAARMVAFGEYDIDGTASTIKERDYKDATDLVAFPINTQLGLRGAETSNSTREGIGIWGADDPAFTLQRAHSHAVATHGGGFDVTPTLTSNGDAHSGFRDEHGLVPVAFPINTQIGLRGAKTSNSSREGIGLGDDGDPSFTLQRAHSHAVATQSAVRRLTPIECERLQGFPDDFTRIPYRNKPAEQCPDGPRYKALGNSMAVPVMRWIGERIQMVENLEC